MDQHFLTLDHFMQKPLTRRTEKFIQLCEFYRSVNSRYPESPFLVFDFIHEKVLPFELRHFKMLSQNQITTAFWKWQRIMGIATVHA
ncbi:MAG: hypothetical protein B2I17_10085 [Thermoplasmatales archaeon B_DKE]|nr:MAG: hypothetical protein B2I17_10085 [Thermoplasmatales archaeon B_DKE]